MESAPIDLDDVRDALTARDVLAWAGLDAKPGGRGELQSHSCPRMHHSKSPRAFTINAETGRWKCHACSAADGELVAGDLFSIIAERERLDVAGADFARVVAIAASIAGVTPSTATFSVEEAAARQRARAERQERARQRELDAAAAEQAKRIASIPKATEFWNALLRRHVRGEEYLASRGVIEALSFDVVRFRDNGSPAIALRTSDGRVTDVITRRLPELAPTPDDRFRPIGGCFTRGTYVNALSEIEAGRDVVMAEGFFDSLTATLAWRRAVVIGARHAEDVHGLMPYVAKRVLEKKTRLVLVPHADDSGRGAIVAASKHANHAQLTIAGGSLAVVREYVTGDLNDAWRGGWRPT